MIMRETATIDSFMAGQAGRVKCFAHRSLAGCGEHPATPRPNEMTSDHKVAGSSSKIPGIKEQSAQIITSEVGLDMTQCR
jgi:hypothetical protein